MESSFQCTKCSLKLLLIMHNNDRKQSHEENQNFYQPTFASIHTGKGFQDKRRCRESQHIPRFT